MDIRPCCSCRTSPGLQQPHLREFLFLSTPALVNTLIQAFTLAREFIFGNNQTGLVTNTSSGGVTVVGGEVSTLGNEIMTGEAAIYYGQATTASSYFFPSATVEAWNAFIASATPTSGAIVSVGSMSSNMLLGSMLAIALGLLL